MIQEVLCGSLGIAIAKAVMKVWLRDKDLAANISLELAPLIAKHFNEYRVRTATERQFRRIAERAAETLVPLFEHEWRDLKTNDIEAVVNSVANCINRTKFDASILAESNLEPDHLATNFRANAELIGLAESQLSLFDKLLFESCQMIVDLSEYLPGFNRQTIKEILVRETEIIERVDRVLEETVRVRHHVENINPIIADAKFEESYRRNVGRKLDQIELFGVEVTGSSRRHNLTTAYISLSVAAQVAAPKSRSRKKSDDRTDVSEDTGETDVADIGDQSIRVESAIHANPRLLIRGEAGSGKTTLLQYLAVKTATADFKPNIGGWNERVPFFIRLRALTDNDLPQPEYFPSLIAPSISAMMPDGWVHEILEDGRGLVLIDGVDEVSESRRTEVREWVNDLITSFPTSRYILTTRPYAISNNWLKKEGFRESELLPMNYDDIEQFIDHWHEAVSLEETEQIRKDELIRFSQTLKERLYEDRPLRELATTPLLCAMICAMHRERREALPSNRLSLYDAALDMLLHRRDIERKLKFADLPEIELEEKKVLLQEIAFWLMENEWAMVDEGRAARKIASLLPGFTRISSNVSATDILKVLIQRSGILRSPVDGTVDFIHKTFQEFLCARAIIDGDRLGFLTANSLGERWRDIAVMTAGLADEKRREEFIFNLIDLGDSSKRKQSIYYLVVIACLETCIQLSPHLQKEIKSRISKVKPPRNMSEAKALSAAGDLAIQLLRKHPKQHARHAATCVRTLRLIGSDNALRVLADYGSDNRSTVIQEIVGAWDSFDQEEYARYVMSKCSGYNGHLELENFENLRGIRYLKQVNSLSIPRPKRLFTDSDYKEISHLGELQQLRLVLHDAIDNIDFLSPLKKLRSIEIVANTVFDTSALSNLDKTSGR